MLFVQPDGLAVDHLQRAKDESLVENLKSGFERITGTGAGEMGSTYKALVIAHSSLTNIAGVHQ